MKILNIKEFYEVNSIDEDFDEAFYQTQNPETKNFYQPYCTENNYDDKHRLFYHYKTYAPNNFKNKSQLENLIPKDFDWISYVERYKELKHLDSKEKAAQHFLLHGSKEKRIYKKSMLDLPTEHYVQNKLYKMSPKTKVLVSVLLYQPEQSVVDFIKKTCYGIFKQLELMGCESITLFIRNNSFDCNQEIIKDACLQIKSELKYLSVCFYNNYNIGYGKGHNKNFDQQESDLFLCLNDDIEIEDFNWLNEAVYIFESRPNVAIVGSSNLPQFVNEFGCGHDIKTQYKQTPDYSEGSVLFIRSCVFKQLSGFDNLYRYFYFEDVDFCLRAKQIGFEQENINIKIYHKRAQSSNKIPESIKNSIVELNRSKFLCRWRKYLSLKSKEFKNRILINLNVDGFGDMVDALYPVSSCLMQHKLNNVDISLSTNKLNFLYELLPKIKIVNDFDQANYDTIYNLTSLNYSYPMHTIDLICAKLNVVETDTNPYLIKQFIEKFDSNFNPIEEKYVVLHLDSQRVGFEGRMPKQDKFIDLIDYLSGDYKIVLIGQRLKKENKFYCNEYEKKIEEYKNKNILFDQRDVGSIKDMFVFINNAFLFIGIDSGPSHIAQLLNTPSFIIYGPINPMTKIYRYQNSGCFYNLNSGDGGGDYHLNLEPSYHFDIRRDFRSINFNSKELVSSIDKFIKDDFKFNWINIFENLRVFHKEILNLQFNNPIFYNPIFEGQGKTVGDRVEFISQQLLSYESYCSQIIRSLM